MIGRYALILACWALAGCQTVVSTNPILPDSAAVADPRLLGTWLNVSDSSRAVVTLAGARDYLIALTERNDSAVFRARLGRQGPRWVLDASPRESGVKDDWLIPGHVLAVLEFDDQQLRLLYPRGDSLKRHLDDGRLRLPYLTLANGDIVLTASTQQLTSSLSGYLEWPGVLDTTVWRRAPGAVAAAQLGPVDVPCFEVSAWREADQLFHRDPHWVGADVASSVDLGGGRTLWLFGDTWIDRSGRGTRQGARMVSNSVAIQTGTDPSTAAIVFYWGRTADGSPAPFFPDRGAESLWLGNGVRVGDRLVLFFARTLRTRTGIGFEHVGWTAVMVENPDAEPSTWRVRPLETPTNPLGILVGYAAVLQLGEHVYALGSQNPVKSHPIYAARWPAEEVRRGSLRRPEWWAGERLGWVADSSGAPRWPLFENGGSELTIHVDQATQRFVGVQTQGFGRADVLMRAAPTLTGPWSAPQLVYRPPEYYRPNVMIYAGKAHAQLTGGDLVLTYATNTSQFTEYRTDSLIYYPRFVRLTRCR